jgi:hypothetical protein
MIQNSTNKERVSTSNIPRRRIGRLYAEHKYANSVQGSIKHAYEYRNNDDSYNLYKV